MVEVKPLTSYSPEVAEQVRGLLRELSRSGTDKGEIPEDWFLEIINSPWHDLMLAYEDNKIIGMMSLSIVMGAGIVKNAYLEDFVVSEAARGKGVGGKLWETMIEWARLHGAKRIEFTCGKGRETALQFYLNHGASTYQTNFMRFEIND